MYQLTINWLSVDYINIIVCEHDVQIWIYNVYIVYWSGVTVQKCFARKKAILFSCKYIIYYAVLVW